MQREEAESTPRGLEVAGAVDAVVGPRDRPRRYRSTSYRTNGLGPDRARADDVASADTEYRKQPKTQHDNDDDIEECFDRRGHRDVGVDEIEPDADDDEHDDELDQGH